MTSLARLRIVVITQGLSPIVRPLVCAGHDVVALVESAPRPVRGMVPSLRRFISRMLRVRSSLKGFAARRDIRYVRLSAANMGSFRGLVAELAPDVMVVFSMSQLLPTDVAGIPRFGTLNLHPSRLPRYRGPDPLFWMCHDHDLAGGVTLHYIDRGEDTGDIVAAADFDIVPGMPLSRVRDVAIAIHGVPLLLDALDVLQCDAPLPGRPQAAESPTRRARRVDASELPGLVDWQRWPASRVWHFLKGTWSLGDAIGTPGLVSFGRRWQIGELESRNSAAGAADVPGTIGRDARGPYVACRDGRIRLSVVWRPRDFGRWLLNR